MLLQGWMPMPMPISRKCGTCELLVPARHCRAVAEYLRDNGGASLEGLRLRGDVRIFGYTAYTKVNASHDCEAQLKHTKQATCEPRGRLKDTIESIPGLKAILHVIADRLGINLLTDGHVTTDILRAIHFLHQDESMQASFAYHTDDVDVPGAKNDSGRKRLLTVVVQLTPCVSAMHVDGFPLHSVFTGCGSAFAFAGAAVHGTSIPCDTLQRSFPSVWKVAFFLLV